MLVLGVVYPRVCGGNVRPRFLEVQELGLSPRVRGKRDVSFRGSLGTGSIPACAGETGWSNFSLGVQTVYPRVCGGNILLAGRNFSVSGLSPRVRGKPGRPDDHPIQRGSIPACAGETRVYATQAAYDRVYPRVCGGNLTTVLFRVLLSGLSPRVRGKHNRANHLNIHRRSIPACAGETTIAPHRNIAKRVYPRVCGGNSVTSVS